MAYFKIGSKDYSSYVNELSVNTNTRYNAQANAAGDTVADVINKKRVITVGIIPLDDSAMKGLQEAIDAFNVSISFRNPLTNALEENVDCIIPSNAVSYYTIQVNKVMYDAFTLSFEEL